MTNPHFTIAIAETRSAELIREAKLHRLAAESGRQSLWSRVVSRRAERQPTSASRPASTVVTSSQAA